MTRLNQFPLYCFCCTAMAMLLLQFVGQWYSITGVVIGWIYCFGIPHGGLDVLVIRQLCQRHWQKQLIAFVAYAGFATLCFLIWLQQPLLCAILFLLGATWHFAEDWGVSGNSCQPLALGALAVTFPALVHRQETGQIFTMLLLPTEQALTIARVMQCVALVMLTAVLVGAFMGKIRRKALLPIFTMTVSGLALSPMLYFACYFCGYHAALHTIQVSRQYRLPLQTLLVYLVIPMIFTTVLFLFAYYGLESIHIQQLWLSTLFIGLFSLTMPHLLLHFFGQRFGQSF